MLDAEKGVLLQHRATWSDQGGTWGLPGGALHQGEDAVNGALREANEEAAVPPASVRVLFTSVFDVGYWSYTTVAAQVIEPFEPAISDPESLELQWVSLEGVTTRSSIRGLRQPGPRCGAGSRTSRTPERTPRNDDDDGATPPPSFGRTQGQFSHAPVRNEPAQNRPGTSKAVEHPTRPPLQGVQPSRSSGRALHSIWCAVASAARPDDVRATENCRRSR